MFFFFQIVEIMVDAYSYGYILQLCVHQHLGSNLENLYSSSVQRRELHTRQKLHWQLSQLSHQ